MQTSLLIQGRVVVIHVALAEVIGLNEAIMLQQIHYWLQKSTHVFDGIHWFYKSYPDWQKELSFWSVDTIKRTVTSLITKNFVRKGNFNTMAMDRTNWYTINYENVPTIELDPSSGEIVRPSVQNAPTIVADCTDHSSKMPPALPIDYNIDYKQETKPAFKDAIFSASLKGSQPAQTSNLSPQPTEQATEQLTNQEPLLDSDHPCPICHGEAGHRINCPNGIAFSEPIASMSEPLSTLSSPISTVSQSIATIQEPIELSPVTDSSSDNGNNKLSAGGGRHKNSKKHKEPVPHDLNAVAFLTEVWCEEFEKEKGVPDMVEWGKDGSFAKRLLETYAPVVGWDRLRQAVRTYLNSNGKWITERGHKFCDFCEKVPQLLAAQMVNLDKIDRKELRKVLIYRQEYGEKEYRQHLPSTFILREAPTGLTEGQIKEVMG